jgi:hypothetical protein
MNEHYDDLVQELAKVLTAVVDEYLAPMSAPRPGPARIMQAQRILDRLITLGWRPHGDRRPDVDQHGVVQPHPEHVADVYEAIRPTT